MRPEPPRASATVDATGNPFGRPAGIPPFREERKSMRPQVVDERIDRFRRPPGAPPPVPGGLLHHADAEIAVDLERLRDAAEIVAEPAAAPVPDPCPGQS